jgi:hypothetical protein
VGIAETLMPRKRWLLVARIVATNVFAGGRADPPQSFHVTEYDWMVWGVLRRIWCVKCHGKISFPVIGLCGALR